MNFLECKLDITFHYTCISLHASNVNEEPTTVGVDRFLKRDLEPKVNCAYTRTPPEALGSGKTAIKYFPNDRTDQ